MTNALERTNQSPMETKKSAAMQVSGSFFTEANVDYERFIKNVHAQALTNSINKSADDIVLNFSYDSQAHL